MSISKKKIKPKEKATELAREYKQMVLLEMGVYWNPQTKKAKQKDQNLVQKILHLSEWTPDCWIHGKAGGDLANVMDSIMKMRKKASEKMVTSKDLVAHEVAVEVDLCNGDNMRKLELDLPQKEITKEILKRREAKLNGALNGKALTTMAKSYVKRESLWYGTTMKSTNRIICWKILSGTLPTSINKKRGRANRAEKMCRHCGNSAETTNLHILAECGTTRNLRNVSHNKICDKIAKELKLMQRRIGLVNLKPDITITHENKITFVEVTIPYEKEALQQREEEKERIYERMTAAKLNLHGIMETETVGLEIGAAGMMNKATVKKLTKLKIGHHAKSPQMMAMHYSAQIWKIHERT